LGPLRAQAETLAGFRAEQAVRAIPGPTLISLKVPDRTTQRLRVARVALHRPATLAECTRDTVHLAPCQLADLVVRVPQRTIRAATVHERALLVLRLGLLLLLHLVRAEAELLCQRPRRTVTMFAGVLRDAVVLVGAAYSVAHVLAVGGVLDVPVVQEPALA